MNEHLSKAPPHNREAEQSVLGAMLFDNRALAQVLEKLTEEHLYDESHRRIFGALREMYAGDSPQIDLVTVSEKLRVEGNLESVGGATYLAELLDLVPTVAHVEHYCRIVEEKAVLRELLAIANEIQGTAYEAGPDGADAALDAAEHKIYRLAERRITTEIITPAEQMDSLIEKLELLKANPREVSGIDTGFIDLNIKTRGFQDSDLIIIAGRPSMGKTSLAMNIATNAAKSGKIVLVFSLEMSPEQLIMRMVVSEANNPGVTMDGMLSGKFGEDAWGPITEAAGRVAMLDKRLLIDPSTNLSEMDIRRVARNQKVRNGLDMIVVDYMQLMEEKGKQESRQQEIATISRRLKGLARELDIPVVALSQLNRGVEKRDNLRPRLSDLRESGAIEQDADVVLLLFREEYYKRQMKEGVDEKVKNMAEVIIAKQRNGPTGTVNLRFFEERVRFDNISWENEYAW